MFRLCLHIILKVLGLKLAKEFAQKPSLKPLTQQEAHKQTTEVQEKTNKNNKNKVETAEAHYRQEKHTTHKRSPQNTQ